MMNHLLKAIKISNKHKNLVALPKQVRIGDKKVYIEKTLLFNRFIVMAEMKGLNKYSSLS